MEKLNERLLSAWLTASTVIDNERLVSTIPFNEAHVCNLLYLQRREEPEVYLTATDLCAKTRMLKSQMNKVLTSLENQRLIERFPSPEDKRKAYIRLVEENLHIFEAVHARTTSIVDYVIGKLGEEEAEQLTELLLRASTIVDESLSYSGGRGHKF
jgi:DNA-binding MarR family transcriptional regulator